MMEFFRLVFKCVKMLASIVWVVVTIIITLASALRHFCLGLYIRRQGEKEIERLEQAIAQAESKQNLRTEMDEK